MSFVFIQSDFFPDWWFNTFSSFSPVFHFQRLCCKAAPPAHITTGLC